MSDATNLSDYESIAAAVQHYINGAMSGKGADMKPAFHEDAMIHGYIGSDMLGGPIQLLFDWNDENGPATDLNAYISSIDLVGTIATVRLELDNWTGHRFTDMYTMLKVDGQWKIISKVFHAHS